MTVIKDLDLLKDINILYRNKVILYGTGNYGKMAVQLLEKICLKIHGFCDSNPTKWGGFCYREEYLVLSLMELKELRGRKPIIVIIAIENLKCISEVLKTLDYCEMSDIVCYTYFALKYTIELHIEDVRIPELYRQKIRAGKNIFANYEKLEIKVLALKAIYHAVYHDAILVYQTGKVGSSSVCAGLAMQQIKHEQVHHIASLRDEYDDMMRNTPKLREGIKLLQTAKKIKIISLVREPVSRDIAAYFQCFREFAILDEHVPDILQGVVGFLDRRSGFGNIGYEFEWFNREIKVIFGIDIYNYTFDKEAGYGVIKENNVEILLLKMEKMKSNEEIIGRFVGIKDYKLVTANVGNDKIYRFAYRDLQQKIKIPKFIVERYYRNNAGMDYFYSETEKEVFLEQLKSHII